MFWKDILGNAESESRENLNDILETSTALYRIEGTRGYSKKGVKEKLLFYLRLMLKIKPIYLYFS